MIEWIGIICCSSVISCMCSLLATAFCLSPTGICLRGKLKKPIKTRQKDAVPEYMCYLKNAKIFKDEETCQGKNSSHYIYSQISPCNQSNTNFEKNQSTEFLKNQSKIEEFRKQLINTINENFTDSKIQTPTEIEIRKTIDDFNFVLQQYNEFILKNSKKDFKKSQSSVTFQIPSTWQKTTNVGTMTEYCQFSDYNLNSKIKKKNNKKKLSENVSSQSVKSVKSCTCSRKISKNDFYPRKITSLKNINKSNSKIKVPGYLKNRLFSKSWVSKTMKRFRYKNYWEGELCECSNVNNDVTKSSKTYVS